MEWNELIKNIISSGGLLRRAGRRPGAGGGGPVPGGERHGHGRGPGGGAGHPLVLAYIGIPFFNEMANSNISIDFQSPLLYIFIGHTSKFINVDIFIHMTYSFMFIEDISMIFFLY